MAFNIDIPGPKLIDLGLYGKLSDLGTTFRQNRDEAYAKDIFANLDLNDPAQVDRAVTQLAHLPQYAGLAQRIAESHQRAQEHAATEDIARRGVAVRESELGRGLDADKAAAERQRKFEEFMSKGDTALPPADTEDGPTIRSTTGIRPSSESQPTTFTPGGQAVKERFPTATGTEDWDLRAQPSTPGPQSELIGGASGQATLLGGDDPLVGPAGPAGPTSPAPVSGEPRLRPASLRETALEKEVQRLTTASQFADGDQLRAMQVRINFLNEERKDLRNRREKALERQQQEALDEKKRRAAFGDESIKEMLKTSVSQSAGQQYAKGILGRMAEITRDPSVVSGEYGREKARHADETAQIGQSLRDVGLDRFIPTAARDFIRRQHEPGRQFTELESLGQQLVSARAGEKGFAEKALSEGDRKALENAVPKGDDSPAIRQSKIALQLAWEDRKQDIQEIRRRGIQQGLTPAQIEDNVAKYGRKYSLIEDSKAKLAEVRGQGGGKAAAPATAPAAPDAEGWTPLPGGGRIRVKP